MDFIEVAKVSEIPVGKMKSVTLQGNEILVANVQGKYYSIADRCTHARGDLSKGTLEGKIVTCPRHGSKFDVTNGKVVGGPAKKDEPSYEVKIEGDAIKLKV